jgi:hypothetical protein
MSGEVLALVVQDEKMGYLVIDSRDGKPVSWHGDLRDANGVAAYLNSTYPVDGLGLSSDVFHAPARDTLIHEVLCMRIAGEPPTCIEAWWMAHPGVCCPWGVPTGPGWDHMIEEARR